MTETATTHDARTAAIILNDRAVILALQREGFSAGDILGVIEAAIDLARAMRAEVCK